MSIAEIEAAITQLPPEEVDKLLFWLEEYQAARWDKQITDDLDSGRLDKLLNEVEEEIEAGLAKPL
jgi:hypothetical protein